MLNLSVELGAHIQMTEEEKELFKTEPNQVFTKFINEGRIKLSGYVYFPESDENLEWSLGAYEANLLPYDGYEIKPKK